MSMRASATAGLWVWEIIRGIDFAEGELLSALYSISD